MRIRILVACLGLAAASPGLASEAFLPQLGIEQMKRLATALNAQAATLLSTPISPKQLAGWPSPQAPRTGSTTENISHVMQVGTANAATVMQSGGANYSAIMQQGQNNSARVVQTRGAR